MPAHPEHSAMAATQNDNWMVSRSNQLRTSRALPRHRERFERPGPHDRSARTSAVPRRRAYPAGRSDSRGVVMPGSVKNKNSYRPKTFIIWRMFSRKTITTLPGRKRRQMVPRRCIAGNELLRKSNELTRGPGHHTDRHRLRWLSGHKPRRWFIVGKMWPPP